MKVLERVVKGLVRQRVDYHRMIDKVESGFMWRLDTTYTIFVVCQLQKKLLAADKPLYLAFTDLKKAFDPVL